MMHVINFGSFTYSQHRIFLAPRTHLRAYSWVYPIQRIRPATGGYSAFEGHVTGLRATHRQWDIFCDNIWGYDIPNQMHQGLYAFMEHRLVIPAFLWFPDMIGEYHGVVVDRQNFVCP
jgi:hypothetical protein